MGIGVDVGRVRGRYLKGSSEVMRSLVEWSGGEGRGEEVLSVFVYLMYAITLRVTTNITRPFHAWFGVEGYGNRDYHSFQGLKLFR